MHILIVSATPFEVAPTVEWLEDVGPLSDELSIEFLVAGIGQVATAYALGRRLADVSRPVDLLIQVGIAGSFDHQLPLGSVVYVNSDRMADLGAEAATGKFLDLKEIGLTYPAPCNASNGALRIPTLPYRALHDLPWVAGLTVNQASGSDASIEALRLRFPTITVETMEGAAAAFAAVSSETDFVHLRGISNYVTARDRESWRIGEAVEAVNEVVQDLLKKLT